MRSGSTSAVLRFLAGPADPIRLEFFRVSLGFSLLAYVVAWGWHGGEWLTSRGFHVSAAAAGAYRPVVPVLAPVLLPFFAVVYLGSLGAFLVGWKLKWAVPLALAGTAYVTLADPLTAFSLNRIHIVALMVLACVPLGTYLSLDPPPAGPLSVWPIRLLQTTIMVQYFTAGWCKVAHGDWLESPYVLWTQAQGYYRTDLAALFLRLLPPASWAVMQYVALGFELLSPLLFGVRRLRPLAFVLGGGFQVLSALLMDRLVYFSLQLLSFYFLFLDDHFLHAVRSRLLSLGPDRAK
jgi:Vitamin K-dependent gamma-carboxylase